MTHVKQPHPHREMMKAYADDMSLCVFVKNANTGEWWEISRNIEFNRYQDCFLCLPKHKDAVLEGLNSGSCQIGFIGKDWVDTKITSSHWASDFWYMCDTCNSRIKPKKVKRWIGVRGEDGATTHAEETEQEARSETSGVDGVWQFIEIEIQE